MAESTAKVSSLIAVRSKLTTVPDSKYHLSDCLYILSHLPTLSTKYTSKDTWYGLYGRGEAILQASVVGSVFLAQAAILRERQVPYF